MVWRLYNDASNTEDAENSLREQAEAAIAVGRMEVFSDMLGVREEFLKAARAEFARAESTETDEEKVVGWGMGALFLDAACVLRRAAQLSSLKAPNIQDVRLLKVIEGGLN